MQRRLQDNDFVVARKFLLYKIWVFFKLFDIDILIITIKLYYIYIVIILMGDFVSIGCC